MANFITIIIIIVVVEIRWELAQMEREQQQPPIRGHGVLSRLYWVDPFPSIPRLICTALHYFACEPSSPPPRKPKQERTETVLAWDE